MCCFYRCWCWCAGRVALYNGLTIEKTTTKFPRDEDHYNKQTRGSCAFKWIILFYWYCSLLPGIVVDPTTSSTSII